MKQKQVYTTSEKKKLKKQQEIDIVQRKQKAKATS